MPGNQNTLQPWKHTLTFGAPETQIVTPKRTRMGMGIAQAVRPKNIMYNSFCWGRHALGDVTMFQVFALRVYATGAFSRW